MTKNGKWIVAWRASLGLLLGGGCLIHALAAAVEKPAEPVLSDLAEPLTLEITHGTCLVWSKPVYCSRPGEGYRLVVENGRPDGTGRVSHWQVTLDGGDLFGGTATPSAPTRKERPLRLDPRQEVRLVLKGEPGSFVCCRIEGEAVAPVLKTTILKDGTKMVVGTAAAGRFSAHSASPVAFDPERPDPAVPAPQVELSADRTAISIGEAVTLRWGAIGAAQTTLYLPGNVQVPAAGSAIFFPEDDATVRVSALGRGGRAEREVRLQVTVPEPELEVKIEPGIVDLGQQATLSWKSQNARMVRMEGSLTPSLPLRGEMSVGMRSFPGGRGKTERSHRQPFTLEAISGKRKVSRSVVLEVVDPEVRKREEKERAQREARQKTIDSKDDRAIRTRWQEFRQAMTRGNGPAAAACFHAELRERYRAMFSQSKAKLAEIGRDLPELRFVEADGPMARYVIVRPETGENGKQEDFAYEVVFVQEGGRWWIYQL